MSPGQAIQEDGTQQISLDVGTHIMTQLAKLRDQYEIIGDVRGKGMQIGVEMVKDKVAGVCVFFCFSLLTCWDNVPSRPEAPRGPRFSRAPVNH